MINYYLRWVKCLQSFRLRLSIILCLTAVLISAATVINAQSTDRVTTCINPVLPGSHPDQTLLKVGNDFYTSGSSFHWTANFLILHSTDMVSNE